MEGDNLQANNTAVDTTQTPSAIEKFGVPGPSTIAEDKTVKISITIPTNAYFMSGLRDFTMNVVRNMTGFSQQWSFRMQSVVDELVNNAIEYGSAPGQDVKITFLSNSGKDIEIFVEDTGTGPKKKTAQEMTSYVEEKKNMDPTKITSLRGRGLSQIVANWTDVLEFKNNAMGGLTIHVTKFLEREDQN
jgi:anti-sigma regulatory factor (Ser/Thr protein kinase)